MWYEEAVFYHIYPLGMLGAPKVNDYTTVEHRLRELDDWIGHIKEMGFNAIYIGPFLSRWAMVMRLRITGNLIRGLVIMMT